jgi:hypothetical protein
MLKVTNSIRRDGLVNRYESLIHAKAVISPMLAKAIIEGFSDGS